MVRIKPRRFLVFAVTAVALLGAAAMAVAQPPPAPAQPAPQAAAAVEPKALLQLAESEAARLRDPAQKALALADVALAWRRRGETRWEKTWASALAEAEAVTDPVAGALTWRGLAVRLWMVAPDNARSLLDRATKLAGDLKYRAQKALALREIGRSLIGKDNVLAGKLLAEAAGVARTIEAPIFRAAALRDIAAALGDLDQPAAEKLFSEAIGLLAPADPDETVQLGRIEIVAAWCRLNLSAALAEGELIGDPRLRETCYRRMCEALAPVNPDEALMVAAKIRDVGERALALATLACQLADKQPETASGMAAAALASGDKLQGPEHERLLADVAVALAPRDAARALEILAKIPDEQTAGEALKRIVVRLARTRPEEALRVLEGIQEWDLREAALADIMPDVARWNPARAAAAADTLLARRERVRALLTIAAVMSEPEPGERAVTP